MSTKTKQAAEQAIEPTNGVLLDHAITGVALATKGWSPGRTQYEAVVVQGNRAWATDGCRLHMADLPLESERPQPPLLLRGAPLHSALKALIEPWEWHQDARARVVRIDDAMATVAVPTETEGPRAELHVEVPLVNAPIEEPSLGEFDANPAAMISVSAEYLRDAAETMRKGVRDNQAVTVIVWTTPPALGLVSEVDGRQRVALIAPLLVDPMRPWWWDAAGEREE